VRYNAQARHAEGSIYATETAVALVLTAMSQDKWNLQQRQLSADLARTYHNRRRRYIAVVRASKTDITHRELWTTFFQESTQ
jgi:hypothetical protein